jgi:hypothetical protein
MEGVGPNEAALQMSLAVARFCGPGGGVGKNTGTCSPSPGFVVRIFGTAKELVRGPAQDDMESIRPQLRKFGSPARLGGIHSDVPGRCSWEFGPSTPVGWSHERERPGIGPTRPGVLKVVSNIACGVEGQKDVSECGLTSQSLPYLWVA